MNVVAYMGLGQNYSFGHRLHSTEAATGNISGRHMPQLDGVRALAVWAVFIAHWSGPAVKDLLPWGELGVDAFFVLSGYLITGILLDSRERHSFRDATRLFYVRRVLRIFPAYCFLVGLLLALNFTPVRAHGWWYVLHCYNLLFLWLGAWNGVTDHFWSLSVEEQFYLCWPCVSLRVPPKRLPLVIVAVIGVGLASRVASSLLGFGLFKLFPLCSFDFLGTGVLLAYSARRDWRPFHWLKPRLSRLALMGMLGFLGIAVFHRFARGNAWTSAAQTTCTLPFLAWFVWATGQGLKGLPGRVMQSPFLRFSGRISYGLYLYHMPVAYLLFRSIGSSPAGWAGFAAAATATYVAATASWFAIEQPLLKLKRHFEY